MSYTPPHLRDDGGDHDVNTDETAAVMSETGEPPNNNPYSMPPSQEPPVGERVVSTTCVYVEYLPLNVTVEEVAHEFSQCGELAKDDNGHVRIKLYKNRDGSLKGDGIVNYTTAEGAETAIADMDGRPLRMFADDDDDEAMEVTMAFFEQKEKKQRQPQSPRDSNRGQRDSRDTRESRDGRDHQREARDWRDPAGSPPQQRPFENQETNDSYYDLPPKQPKGKPKPVVDADGWETVGPMRSGEEIDMMPAVPAPEPAAPEVSKPKEKKAVKQSTSVISFDGSVHRGWGDDSSDEESSEDEEEPAGPVEIEDIDGIDDMTGDVGGDTDSEDEDVKNQRKQDALAAKEQATLAKPKSKKQSSKQGLSKKELKELKAKEDEEFERLLTQAVAEVKGADEAVDSNDTATPAMSDSESATPPEASEAKELDKAALAKIAKNKKRKEMAKKKKEEEAAKKKMDDASKAANKAAIIAEDAKAKSKKVLSPAEVLQQKKDKKAKKDAKLAKEKLELNAKKMALQKKAKAERAKSAASTQVVNNREKFHFSSENSAGCDAG